MSEPETRNSKPETELLSMEKLLEIVGLGKTYPTEDGGELEVLQDVSFTIYRGEIVAIVGESGAGKSTLLHLLGTLDRPTEGEVLFEGKDIFEQTDNQLAHFRNRSIGFVFQFHHLLPEFTAVENVSMPALIQQKNLTDVRGRAIELLTMLGLQGRLNYRPGQLSGGEKQRVAVARALMNEPSLVLADEPTGNLDTKTADSLHQELLRLRDTMKQTFIIVTHNQALADLADRVLFIEDKDVKQLVR